MFGALNYMDRNWGNYRYTTKYSEDRKDGYSGYELYEESNGKKKKVATILFWDTHGQYFVETFGTDVPLDIMDLLIKETKEKVKIR